MPSSIENSHQVFGEFPGRRFPGDLEFVGATVRVDQPFTAGTLSVTAGPSIFDADKTNDTLSEPLSAVAAAQPAAATGSTHSAGTNHAGTAPAALSTPAGSTTPTTNAAVLVIPNDPGTIAVTAATKPLSHTDGSVLGAILISAVLLLAAAGAFVIARRRIRARG
jgi:hypothetical protein